MDAASIRDRLRRTPKVELHVHLEGALRPARLFRILQRHSAGSEYQRPEDLSFLYQHSNFQEFLDHFRYVVTSLREVRDVHEVALDLFQELAAQNVVYAEVIFSAAIFMRTGMPLDELLAAVSDAEEQVLGPQRAGVAPTVAPRYNFVIDLVRNFGPESASRLAAELARAAHPRVVGIHLGGDEVRFPARLFEAAFAAAREAGLGLAAHAGEADGAASVRDAIDRLGVGRVGHGIRCIEDPGLVRELARRQIALEICPTSNLRTGVVTDLARHPLSQLLRAGVPVTLGADDPSFFDTDLERELWLAHSEMGIGLEEVEGFADTALAASFLPEAERAARRQDLARRRANLSA